MAKKRKTATQHRQEAYEADRRAWEIFQPKLAAVQSFNDALLLHAQAVPPDTPGRKYYSNFGFFLQTFAPPDGANLTELVEYLRLIAIFDSEGALKPEVRPQIEARLQEAITRRHG